MNSRLSRRMGYLLLLIAGSLLVLSACNLGAPNNNQEATLTSEPNQSTVAPTTTEQVQGGVTVFPTTTPFVFSTRPVNPPTSIVIVPNNPAPPTNTPAPVSIVIVSPLSGNVASGTVQVVGSASHPNFLQYRLEYAPQNNPNNTWFPITGIVQTPTIASVLGVWSTNTGTTPDGLYQLRLRVFLRDGTVQTTQVNNVRVQNQQPTPIPTNTTTPRPIAAFTQDVVSGTAPLVVRFESLSSGAISSHSWSFGDGGSSNATNPTYTYRTPGTYTVRLTVNGPGGSSNVSRQITVNSPTAPIAMFVPSVVSGPSPLTVEFDEMSTGQITSYEWDFGDETTTTTQEPTHVFNDPGTYNVILRVVGPGGSGTIIRQITVEDPAVEAPVASFTVESTNIETGDTINFTNTTEGEVTSFLWDFDGNNLTDNTDISPTHTYNTAGTYTARLTAIGEGGQSSAEVTIVVSNPPDAPTASFDFTADGTIAPVTVTFNNTTEGDVTSYEWIFGNAGSSSVEDPVFQFTEAGSYPVTLTAIGPGGQTTTEEVVINVETPLDPPEADFLADPQSGEITDTGFTVDFTNNSTGSALTYAWDFGDGAISNLESPSYTYTSTGSYPVTLTVTDPQGQTDTANLTINVSEAVVIAEPNAGFSYLPTDPVVDQTVNFTNTTEGEVTGFEWNFGDGSPVSTEVNPMHSYTTAGEYTVTLTATGPGGVNTVTDVVVVGEGVTAPTVESISASPNPVTVNEATVFSAMNVSANAETYSWAFGDGATSTDANPSHTYTVAGTYTATLSVSNSAGSSETVQVVVTVSEAPTPPSVESINANPNPVMVNEATVFSATNVSANAETYAWAFGDGSTSDQPNPSHTYTVAGEYTATLFVSNAQGDSSTVQTTVTVSEAPTPPSVESISANPNPVTVNEATVFSATNVSANAETYAWAFGDGGTSDQPNPSHTYTVAGEYTATLFVSNAQGDSSTVQTTVTVSEAPTPPSVESISANPNPVTVNEATVFSATNVSANAETYAWAFGDGGTSDQPNPSHTYTVAGEYTATLFVSNAQGDSSTVQTTVTVNEAPTPPSVESISVNPNPVTVNEATVFSATNVSANAETYAWAFGDGSTSDQPNPSHTYTVAGEYTATLFVSNAQGDSATVQTTVTVNEAPTAPTVDSITANPSTVVTGELVQFSANGVSANAETYAWQFGDGTTSDQASPSHTYSVDGVYTALLTVSNSVGSSEAVSVQVTVNPSVPLPIVESISANPNPVTVNTATVFSATNVMNAETYAWQFGDGGTSDQPNPSHTYTVAGTYTATLTVSNSAGSSPVVQTTVVVEEATPLPTVESISANPNPVTVNTATVFSATNAVNAETYAWQFGDGGTSDQPNPSYTYTVAGTYTATLTVSNSAGSSPVVQTTVVVEEAPAPLPTVDGISANPNPVTVNTATVFSATNAVNAETYAWQFGDGGTSDQPNPSYTYTVAGTYTATLVVSNSAGSSPVVQTTVVVEEAPAPLPTVDGISANPNPVTVNTATVFSATNAVNAETYAWQFGDGGTSDQPNPSYTYTVAGTYTATLVVSNSAGSSPVVQTTVVVEEAPAPLPTVDSISANPNPVTVNTATVFSATNAVNAETYTWNFGDGGTSDQPNPSHTYTVAGTYTATLVVNNGAGSSPSVETVVTVEEASDPAPTGALLYVSNATGNLDIYVADANGQNAINVTESSWNEIDPVWSPDGTRIAFASNQFGDNDIYVLTLDTGVVTQITTSGANDVQPSWSPDGAQLAFASDRNNLNVNNDIFVVNVADLNAVGAPVAIISTPADDQQPTWNPNGNRIAYMSDAAGEGTNNIYLANTNGNAEPTQLTTGNSDNEPSWSSTNVIAFTSGRTGNNEIFTIRANGSQETQLTNNGANDRLPEWSADGSTILYTSDLATDGSGGTTALNVWSMDANGDGQISITTSGNDDAQGDLR